MRRVRRCGRCLGVGGGDVPPWAWVRRGEWVRAGRYLRLEAGETWRMVARVTCEGGVEREVRVRLRVETGGK